MTFKPREKAKDSGPVLKRDANNKLDQDAADKVLRDLAGKLADHESARNKDLSFSAKGNKRDFVIMVTVMQRNSVDGHVVIGEDESRGFEVMDPRDPFKYRIYDFVEAPILAKNIPMRRASVGKQMLGIFNVLVNYLAKLSIVDSV